MHIPSSSVTSNPASLRSMAKNDSLDLHHTEQVWQVRSGMVALCQIEAGQRRCFFTAQPGDLILGTSHQGKELVAIAIEPATVEALA